VEDLHCGTIDAVRRLDTLRIIVAFFPFTTGWKTIFGIVSARGAQTSGVFSELSHGAVCSFSATTSGI
jgi:hypothetical protein